ncbi:hypothetical protein [Pseudomonas syringae]|uniref:hypothetical protein n=1 Tax=Pseudomonas syringae TaxID=317 RepID=UPI001360B2EC|nr:hypothetical protein [Pseudomonas syringae]
MARKYMAECHTRIAKGLHAEQQIGYLPHFTRAVRLDPTTGEQGVHQDQGRSTIAGKAADRELEWSWYKPASAGFLLPAFFAGGKPAGYKIFPDAKILARCAHDQIRIGEV